ncbi:MAG: ABC transporter ATP-binding protein [Ruminococcaceae bacterium]|nr:ABC transporter ATP-binding protein [Oscillospiraceae bacterium]
MAGEVLIDLFQPKLMSHIVDESISGKPFEEIMPTVILTGVLMLVLVAVGGLCGSLSAYTAGVASERFGDDLRRDGFNKVMSLSLQQTDKFTTGSLVTRLTNDIVALRDLVMTVLRMLIRAPMFLIGGLVMCLTLDVNFGYVLLASIPVQIVIVVIMIKYSHPIFSKVQKKLDNVNSVVQENVSGARVVKAYTNEEFEIERFDRANKDYRNTNLSVLRLFALVMPVLMIVMNLAVIAIILIGGYRAEAQALNVGDVMAATQYITRVLMAIMMVSNIFQQASRAQASASRVREILECEPVIKDGPVKDSDEKGTVRFENVSFAYPESSGVEVLSGISFEIKRGETVAVIGSTGCGKTSLVNLIPRFYDATIGNVYIDGVNVKDWDTEALRRRISFVLQKSELFSGTVKENIMIGSENATDEEVLRAAEIAQADSFVSQMPNKYYTYVAEKGASLSGGQKQRIAIARGILRRPEIIIFDDSTSALDLTTEAKVQKGLRENLEGTTVIMIAQRIASVMNADRIAVIENGALVAFDNHENLMKSCDTYKDIYASQMKGGSGINE